MAKLHYLLDGKQVGEFALDQERITIGRRPSNQIHIDNLAVSGVHAIIVTIGNDSFLEDLNSTNGTLLNGKNIKKHVLQHEDIIEFGKYQLKYINESQVASHHDGFEKTLMMTPVRRAKPADDDIDPIQNAITEKVIIEKPIAEPTAKFEKNENVGRLQVLSGASAGRELSLNKTLTTLGKPGSQVAVITKRPQGYFITHVGGNNLPTVNGQTIGVHAHALNHQDIVELAGTKMEFFLD